MVRALELAVAEGAAAVEVTGAKFDVQGIGLVDPIANWSMMRNPIAFLSPQDVRTIAATVKNRKVIGSLLIVLKGGAQTTGPPERAPNYVRLGPLDGQSDRDKHLEHEH